MNLSRIELDRAAHLQLLFGSNCYLGSYALVNISTFHVDLIQPLGWRPTFRFFNKWLSLLGCILSVGAMFLGSWPTALITFVIIFALFLVIRHRKPGKVLLIYYYKENLNIF